LFGNASALILGHAHPSVIRAVEKQLIKGTVYILPTMLEVKLAKELCNRIPSLQRVRFVNSGTEANIHLYRTARALTGKRKIAKMEGGYHGSDDTSQISDRPPLAEAGDPFEPVAYPCTQGIPPSIADDVVVFPFNNLDAAERIVANHRDDLAGVIVEPFASRGYIPAEEGFLQGLHEITKQHDILLLFDEVHSFRLAPGGAQELYGVTPDLTSLGKIIGGGFPVGAFGGRADIMDLYDLSQDKSGTNLVHHGTFNANPVTVVAGLATLEELTLETYQQLTTLGDEMRRRVHELLDGYRIPGHTTGEGSLFKIQFTQQPVTDYRSTFKSDKIMEQRMFYFMLNRGVYVCRTGRIALSTPVKENEMDHFLDVLEDFLKAVS
jgi:glutamate-1-semialdehyde 2,1-aminomutase